MSKVTVAASSSPGNRRTAKLTAALTALAAVSASPPPSVNQAVLMAEDPPANFADFGLFLDAGMREPAPRVVPYELNSPLFSDYADKIRFVYVPEGELLSYEGEGLLGLPIGTALVKHFGFARTDGSLDLIETRILIHKAGGWKAYPYVWNEDDTQASLKKAGARVDVAGRGADGMSLALGWRVPNVNQCKGCHSVDGDLMPIGPKGRNLSGDTGARNELTHLTELGLLRGVPRDPPLMPDWHDESVPVDLRARAYLDVNCGHCHNRAGPASNSGLLLTWETETGPEIGIGKGPVAAGRGSGGRLVGIDPGDPDASILLYRMESTEPGVMMPELARTQRHDEAVELIRQWIAAME